MNSERFNPIACTLNLTSPSEGCLERHLFYLENFGTTQHVKAHDLSQLIHKIILLCSCFYHSVLD
jgi:hypothetical protein